MSRVTPTTVAVEAATEFLDFLKNPTHWASLDGARCGARALGRRLMSFHEFKRNRITCPRCIRIFLEQERIRGA